MHVICVDEVCLCLFTALFKNKCKNTTDQIANQATLICLPQQNWTVMYQSPLTILTTNHITFPTTNHSTDQGITMIVWLNFHLSLHFEDDFLSGC